MGHFHFEVPPAVNEAFLQARWQDAYICGIEGIPWQCRCRYEDAKLTITRSIDASGKLHLVCPVGQLGDRSLSTCSLREVDRPYLLYVELARGSCFRVQSQADAWQRAGLALEPRFEESLLTGTKQFLDAVSLLDDADRASSKAIEAIETLESACDLLGDSYTKQSLAFRKRQEPQIGTLLAGTLIPPAPSRSKHEKEYCTTFNAAAVRLNWADIENDAGRYDYDDAKRSIQWCADNQIRVIGGPLLDFRERMMPHWLYLLEDDFEALLAAIVQFTERTVTELRGTVQLWNAASGLNSKGPISVDDEKSMRIALGILQTIRRLDPGTPAIMSFDQPFGEYLSKDRNGISPLHFADAIARSGLGMAGIGLDIRFNYESQSTFERSAVDFGLMIDRWATLGLPLLATIGIPGGKGVDHMAIAPQDTRFPSSDSELNAGVHQRSMAAPILQSLLAKHVVHGIVWDGWADDEPHVNSHSGLLDQEGRPRPTLQFLQNLRREYLT